MSESMQDTADQQEQWDRISDRKIEDVAFPFRGNANGEAVVVFKTAKGFRGVQKDCPHQGASWMLGQLMGGDTMVRCGLHSFAFKLSDGKGVNCPGFKIQVYDVCDKDGFLYAKKSS